MLLMEGRAEAAAEEGMEVEVTEKEEP